MEKLSELSKPVAQIYYDEHDSSVMRIGWFRSNEPKNPEPLYSQEYVSALMAELEAKDKRIAELGGVCSDASQVFKEIGTELGCNPDNESIMMAIDELKATQMTGPLKDVLKRNIELEAKLATPVRLPKRWDISGQVNPPRIVEVQFEQQNRTHDQCAEAIRAAGFTAEGDE